MLRFRCISLFQLQSRNEKKNSGRKSLAHQALPFFNFYAAGVDLDDFFDFLDAFFFFSRPLATPELATPPREMVTLLSSEPRSASWRIARHSARGVMRLPL